MKEKIHLLREIEIHNWHRFGWAFFNLEPCLFRNKENKLSYLISCFEIVLPLGLIRYEQQV